MVKAYKSFEEIDARLKVLKLQREIDQESLKLHLNRAKVDLIPRRLLPEFGTTLAQSGTFKNMLMVFAIEKALRFFQKRRKPRLIGQ